MNWPNQIILSLATLLFGGVISAWLTYWLSERSWRRRTLIQKLEELYRAADRYERMISGMAITMEHATYGNITLKQYYEMHVKDSANRDVDAFENLKLLAEIYFPGAVEDINVLMQRRAELMHVWIKIEKGLRKSSNPDPEAGRELTLVHDRFKEAGRAARTRISQLGSNLVGNREIVKSISLDGNAEQPKS